MITDVAIVTRYDEDAAAVSVNEWLAANGQSAPLRRIGTDEAGGWKVLTSQIWAGAFNHLDDSGFEEAVRTAPWRAPAEVFAYISYEHGAACVICPALAGRVAARAVAGGRLSG